MTDNKDLSNTMEINSILQEAHQRQNGSDEPAAPRHARSEQEDREPATSAAETSAATADEGDGYVFAEEDETAASDRRAPGEKGSKKNKKPMIIALIIVGALLLAGVVGLIIWKASPSEEPVQIVSGEVIVSGVNVGGLELAEAKAALAPVEQKLADAIRVDVTCGDQKLTLTKEDFTYTFNTDEILKEAQQGKGSGYEVRLVVDESSYAAAAEKAGAALDRKAQNARVSAFNADKSEMFTYQEATTGLKLNREDLIKQLKSLFTGGKTSGSLTPKCDEVKPDYNMEYLKSHLTKLSSFTTVSTNTSNAISNQALSLSACNSSIIEPGATWSFNRCTGDSNLESNGYLPAGVIVQGRYETGIGGGICQSSTTIYNAAILCGMEIVERYCHAYPASYVDYGLDATIDYDNLDLKLKNPFTYQLFLKCWMDGVTLHAEIYGLPTSEFDEVRVSTKVPAGGTGNYTVTASRSFYLKGKLVRTEALPSSTYSYYSTGDDTPDTPSEKPTTTPTTTPTIDDEPTVPDTPGTDPAPDPAEDPGTGEEGGDPPAEPSDAPPADPATE